MPWGRIDDTHYDHDKVLALPVGIRNEAIGLYWRAISYCNAKLTDGYVSASVVEHLDGGPELAAALVRVRLWHRRRGGYVIHDFEDFNRTRSQVEDEREKKAEAGRKGGQRSGETRLSKQNEAAPKQTRSKAEAAPKQTRSKAEARASRVLELPTESHTHTELRESRSPSAVPARAREATASRNGTKGPRLTKAELDAWSAFGPEWDAFRVAWIERGFHLPPTGDATDDEGTSQRAVLWPVVDAWPNRVAEWVREAPGKTPRDVIAHVLERRNELRREAGDDEVPAWEEPTRAEAAEAVGRILERMAQP